MHETTDHDLPTWGHVNTVLRLISAPSRPVARIAYTGFTEPTKDHGSGWLLRGRAAGRLDADRERCPIAQVGRHRAEPELAASGNDAQRSRSCRTRSDGPQLESAVIGRCGGGNRTHHHAGATGGCDPARLILLRRVERSRQGWALVPASAESRARAPRRRRQSPRSTSATARHFPRSAARPAAARVWRSVPRSPPRCRPG